MIVNDKIEWYWTKNSFWFNFVHKNEQKRKVLKQKCFFSSISFNFVNDDEWIWISKFNSEFQNHSRSFITIQDPERSSDRHWHLNIQKRSKKVAERSKFWISLIVYIYMVYIYIYL